MSMTNRHPETGIAYGYIAANALDSELVDVLMYGPQATDANALEEFEAWRRDNPDACDSRFWDSYECDEPVISGEYEGVKYSTSWLGGALNFWIFESPHTTDKARLASPCVPGAAILDTLDGTESGYDVPHSWRASGIDGYAE